MSRETSPFVVGDYWLDKRRDGASPEVWQIATYNGGRRQVVYRSTRLRDLESAKGAILAHVETERARKPQRTEDAGLVAAMRQYWEEHGKHAIAAYAIAGSYRAFLGFLAQDELGVGATIDQVDRAMTRRYTDWRMGPHSWSVTWAGKVHEHSSAGVKGETVATDLARVRAAVNHQLNEGRIPTAPKIHAPDKRLRSAPREYLYSIDQLGAIIAVAAMSAEMDREYETFRWLLLQVATACRPVAALAFDPRTQFLAADALIDLHPPGNPRTRKRNPVVPAIDEVQPFLAAWARQGAKPAKSRKRAWRTIRRILDLPTEAEPKTIRYSIATELRRMGTVPAIQLESLLGHEAIKGVSARYAKYDPKHMGEARAALSSIFRRIMTAALDFSAVQKLSNNGNGPRILIDRDAEKAQISAGNSGAAYRTRTCDPRITNARKGRKTAVSREVQPEQGGKQ